MAILPPRRRDPRAWLARWLFSPLAGARAGDLVRVLLRNRFRVHPLYWPRLKLVILSSLWTSHRARREASLWGGRVEAARPMRPLFILGHYRSGTTHLQNLLSADPRLAYPNYFEASFPWTFLSAPGRTVRRYRRLAPRKRPHDDVDVRLDLPCEDELALASMTFLSPHLCWHFPAREGAYRRYVTFEEAGEAERRLWRKALSHFARKLTVRYRRPIVFKSPCHTGRVRLILETFPDARFVHIHRHPYDVFRSTLHMERLVPPLLRFQRPRADEERLIEWVIWRYRALYGAFLAQRAAVPEGALCEVAYDELVGDPIGTLERIYRGLDLGDFEPARTAAEAHLERARRHRRNAHPELPSALRARLSREWGFVFEAFGYRN